MPAVPHRPTRRKTVQILAAVSVGLLAGCSASAAPPRPPTRAYRVGYLAFGPPPDEPAPNYEAFRAGLRELGYTEGEDLVIERRIVPVGEPGVPETVAALAALPVDVLVVSGTPAIRAASATTRTLPIVMAPATGDPVANGLVASLARPGGNVTGLTDLAATLQGKRLELLKEVVPGLSRVAVLVDPSTPEAAGDWAGTQAAAGPLQVALARVDAQAPAELDAAFDAILQAHPDGFLPLSSPLFFRARERIAAFAARNGLPALHATRAAVEAGGLMAYGASLPELFRRAAVYVDRLLKGARAANLPVEQPAKFELVINLRAAQALELTLPRELLLDATEVIQ